VDSRIDRSVIARRCCYVSPDTSVAPKSQKRKPEERRHKYIFDSIATNGATSVIVHSKTEAVIDRGDFGNTIMDTVWCPNLANSDSSGGISATSQALFSDWGGGDDELVSVLFVVEEANALEAGVCRCAHL